MAEHMEETTTQVVTKEDNEVHFIEVTPRPASPSVVILANVAPPLNPTTGLVLYPKFYLFLEILFLPLISS